MNEEFLFECIHHVDDDLIEDAYAKDAGIPVRRPLLYQIAAAAAVIMVTAVTAMVFLGKNRPPELQTQPFSPATVPGSAVTDASDGRNTSVPPGTVLPSDPEFTEPGNNRQPSAQTTKKTADTANTVNDSQPPTESQASSHIPPTTVRPSHSETPSTTQAPQATPPPTTKEPPEATVPVSDDTPSDKPSFPDFLPGVSDDDSLLGGIDTESSYSISIDGKTYRYAHSLSVFFAKRHMGIFLGTVQAIPQTEESVFIGSEDKALIGAEVYAYKNASQSDSPPPSVILKQNDRYILLTREDS